MLIIFIIGNVHNVSEN